MSILCSIPLLSVPSQSLTITLEDSIWYMKFKASSDLIVADITCDGIKQVLGWRLVANQPVIPFDYRLWLVTTDDEMPDWTKFGSSQFLMYWS